METTKTVDVMSQEDRDFITALIFLAKDMPKDRREPFLWIGQGLALGARRDSK